MERWELADRNREEGEEDVEGRWGWCSGEYEKSYNNPSGALDNLRAWTSNHRFLPGLEPPSGPPAARTSRGRREDPLEALEVQMRAQKDFNYTGRIL